MLDLAVKNILKESPGQRVTTCGFIYEDGSHWISDNHACHAGLSYRGNPGKKIKAVFTKYMKAHPELSKEDASLYVKWLTNDSPYSEIFMLKDPKEIMNGCYLSYPDKPANLLLTGNIATRFIHESFGVGYSSVWAKLVKLGCDPTYAYLFAQNFKSNKNNISFYGRADSHNGVCFTSGSLQKSKNFLNKKFKILLEPYNKIYTYHSLEKLWKEGEDYGNDSLSNFCRGLKVVKIKKHMSYNIFEKMFKKDGDGLIISNDEELVNVFEQFKKGLGG